MNKTWFAPILISMTMGALFPGCGTMRGSVLLGAGVGAGAGAGVGYLATPPRYGIGPTLLGAGVGALTGGLIGALFHKEKRTDTQASDAVADRARPPLPLLTRPEVRSIWIPDKIDANGTRWEQGHYMYMIDKQSTFSE